MTPAARRPAAVLCTLARIALGLRLGVFFVFIVIHQFDQLTRLVCDGNLGRCVAKHFIGQSLQRLQFLRRDVRAFTLREPVHEKRMPPGAEEEDRAEPSRLARAWPRNPLLHAAAEICVELACGDIGGGV